MSISSKFNPSGKICTWIQSIGLHWRSRVFSTGPWSKCSLAYHFKFSNSSTTALLTRRANSTITVLPLKMFFVAYWTHAICPRVPIKSATSGTKHRHLATVSFLSHLLFFYTPEIDIFPIIQRPQKKNSFTVDNWKSTFLCAPSRCLRRTLNLISRTTTNDPC